MKFFLFSSFLFFTSFILHLPSFAVTERADSEILDIEEESEGSDFTDEDFDDEEAGINAEDFEREAFDEDDLERELINEDEDLEFELDDEEELEDEDELEDELEEEFEEGDELEEEFEEGDELEEEFEEGDEDDFEEVEDENDFEEVEDENENEDEDEELDENESELTEEVESEEESQETEEAEEESQETEEESSERSFKEEAEEFDFDNGKSSEDPSTLGSENLSESEEEADFIDEDMNTITNISYISDQDEILIEGSNTISHQSKVNYENKQLIIEILEAQLVEDLKWPYILKDFNTGFGLIQADQKEDQTVRILIQLKEGASIPIVKIDETSRKLIVYFDESSSSLGSSTKLTKQTLPHRTLEELYFGDITFSGSPISFHVVDAPVKQVLRFISEESGLNIVISEGVTGTVTLKLENVPWDQALYTIFKVKDLGYARDGNIITISPLERIRARTLKLREIMNQQKPLSPFKTKVIPISYGKLADIKTKVEEFTTQADTQTGQKAGKVIVHEESNTLIIVDTEETINKIEALIPHFDKAPQQVMVEARIVEAEETLARDFGLIWGLSGNLPITTNITGLTITNVIPKVAGIFKDISGNYAGASNDGGSLSLNLSGIPIVGDIGASLNIAESSGYARVVSSPKIVTISGKEASITRNSPIQIRQSQTTTTTAEGSSSTTNNNIQVDVKISLTVTPTVTSDQTVFLKVNISRSNPGAGRTVQTIRTANTEVLVKNGHTIVIGGIYQYDQGHGRKGIPFFKNIPFLKYLFDNKESNTAKNELLVFLTPKIINSVND